MAEKATLYGISEAARQVGVAERTLRDYDKRGIVKPTRDSAGKRLFSKTDIQRAKTYRSQKELDK